MLSKNFNFSSGSHSMPITSCSSEMIVLESLSNSPNESEFHHSEEEIKDDIFMEEDQEENGESVMDYYFIENTNLLNAYCDALVLKTNTNDFYIHVLLDFFKSRGKLNDLIVSSINFDGSVIMKRSSLFSKFYRVYLKTYCQEYLDMVIGNIFAHMKQIKNIQKTI